MRNEAAGCRATSIAPPTAGQPGASQIWGAFPSSPLPTSSSSPAPGTFDKKRNPGAKGFDVQGPRRWTGGSHQAAFTFWTSLHICITSRGEGEGKSPPATPHSLPRESGPDLLVHFEPSHRVLDGVLQPEEPGFPEPQRPAHQVEQVLPFPLHLRGQEGEAELWRRPLELFPFDPIHSFFFF